MRIKLKRLEIENFKKFKSKVIDFGDNTKISGRNASGKTTIADAFMWCLFNKNSHGETNFDIRPLDEHNNQIDYVEIKVVASMEIDGVDVVFQKVQKQKWTKRRGQEERVFDGNINEMEIDGIPKKDKEYKEFIANLINEDIFRVVTNPMEFVAKHWKEQRTELLKIVPEIDAAKFIETSKELAPLVNQLKLHSSEDLIKKYKGEIKRYNDEIKSNSVRIDEVKRSLSDIDVAEQELQRNALLEEIKEKQAQIDDADAMYADTQKKSDAILDKKFKLNEIKLKSNDNNLAKRRETNNKIYELSSKRSTLDFNISSCADSIVHNKEQIEKYKEEKAKLIAEWREIKDKVYEKAVFDENTTICPMCKRPLPENEIDLLRTEFDVTQKQLEDKFYEEKANKIAEITDSGNRYNELQEKCEKSIAESKESIETKNKELEEIKKEISSLENELSSLPESIDLSQDNEYMTLSSEIEEMEKQVFAGNDIKAKRQQLKDELLLINNKLHEVDKLIASADNSAKEERIESLMAENRDISDKRDASEHMLYLLEVYTKKYIELISESINSHFGIAKWKLFDVLQNGGIVETCECMVNGVPFSSLNSGHRIVAGLDIINALSGIYDVSAPIFLDNAETVNDSNIPKMQGQLILLEVSEDDMKVE